MRQEIRLEMSKVHKILCSKSMHTLIDKDEKKLKTLRSVSLRPSSLRSEVPLKLVLKILPFGPIEIKTVDQFSFNLV